MSKKVEERTKLRGIVKMCVKGVFQDDFFFSVSQNLSATGMLLETERSLAQGDRITCSFFLQRGVTVAGEIVRIERKETNLYNYGVRFVNLDPSSRAQIEEAVKGGNGPGRA